VPLVRPRARARRAAPRPPSRGTARARLEQPGPRRSPPARARGAAGAAARRAAGTAGDGVAGSARRDRAVRPGRDARVPLRAGLHGAGPRRPGALDVVRRGDEGGRPRRAARTGAGAHARAGRAVHVPVSDRGAHDPSIEGSRPLRAGYPVRGMSQRGVPSKAETCSRNASGTGTGRRSARSISTSVALDVAISRSPWPSSSTLYAAWSYVMLVRPIASIRTNTSRRSSNRAGAWYSTVEARIAKSAPPSSGRPRCRWYSVRARSKYGMYRP